MRDTRPENRVGRAEECWNPELHGQRGVCEMLSSWLVYLLVVGVFLLSCYALYRLGKLF